MKIVILDGYAMNPGDLPWDIFDALGEVTRYDRTAADKIAGRIGGSEIVITNKVPITEEIFAACPGVKYVGVTATGYNVVDTAAAKKRGIPVTNVPSYATGVTAQFAIALLLEVCGRVGAHDRAVHEGRWAANADFCFWDYPLIELEGKTLGIIGLGRIGRTVARIAKALGMEVIAYSPREYEEGRSVARYVSLDQLFAESDVISLHCPLFPATQGIINSGAIAKMKDGVIIINCARGPLIVDQDLADALNFGKVYAAALDVAVTEPIRADNPLLKAKNCIITPHIAWAAEETRKRLISIVAENIRAFIAGKPVNVVNA
jgi:glycerate dehydrogenase